MELTLMSPQLEKLAIIDIFDSLIWTDRYDRAGEFELFNRASIDIIQTLKEDHYLKLDQSDHTMIIEALELRTDVDDGNKFVVKGRSLESILDRRIVWFQTVLNTNLQNGIQTLLNQNAISPSDSARIIPNLVFEASTDPAVTAYSMDAQFFGENLYEVVSQLCQNAGLGFRITINSAGQFVFKLYAGADRSYDQLANPFVAFSPDLDNLDDSTYVHTKQPYRNVTLVGGEGDGSNRVTAQVIGTGAGTGLSRREKFTDAADLSSLVNGVQLSSAEYNALLLNRGYLSLIESLPSSSFDGKVDPTTTYVFARDFFLGDIVQIQNEYGLAGKTRITEITFSENLSGIEIYPTFDIME